MKKTVRLIFRSPNHMIRRYTFNAERVVETTDETAPILVYMNPCEEERRFLTGTLKLDEHTLQSSLDPHEVARIEYEPEHVAMIIKLPRHYSAADNFLFRVMSLGLFMFENRLVVVTAEDMPVFDGRKLIRITSIRDLVLRLIYQSTFHFEEHIKVISQCSEEIERGINISINNRQLLNMFTLEKSLVFYLEAIASNRRIISKIKAMAPRLNLTTAQTEFLDDIAIENEQSYDMAQIYSQVISGLMDARASVISNNLNILMKNLNALVIAISIPTFITGIGGMSEFTEAIGLSNRLVGYSVFMLAMLLLGWGIFVLIRKSELFWTTR